MECVQCIKQARMLQSLLGDHWTVAFLSSPCQQAKDKMEKVMPDGYCLKEYEVCHKAQERLRQAMGIM